MSDTLSSPSTDDESFDLECKSLEPPVPTERDWGGDGTDLSRPVRAHILAALRPNTLPYPAPVDALLALGDPGNASVVEHRHALGLGQEYLPDLLRMARDRELYTADGATDAVWAPLHAIAVMGDLDLSDSVPEIIPLFDLNDDWYSTALPELLGKIGAPALEPLRAYLADRSRWAYGHAEASRTLEQIAKQHPELREHVVATLSDVLRDAEHYDEVVNTIAMHTLVELKAVETLPLIRHAFELGRIDEMVRGAWGQVLDDLGIERQEGDPLLAESQRRFKERQEQFFPPEQSERLQEDLEVQTTSVPQPVPSNSRRLPQKQAIKQKNKRKIESASRKANRRKRK